MKRAYSLMREEIPDERTCFDAKIPDEYCVCNQRVPMRVHDPVVVKAANDLVDQINSVLPNNLCKTLLLGRIGLAYEVIK